jgi:hypothetical protein
LPPGGARDAQPPIGAKNATYRHAWRPRCVTIRFLTTSVPARGDAEPDYDVAVFLRDMPDRMAELDRLADLRLSFPDETGAFFDAFPYPASACRDGSSLMHEVRREGRDL